MTCTGCERPAGLGDGAVHTALAHWRVGDAVRWWTGTWHVVAWRRCGAVVQGEAGCWHRCEFSHGHPDAHRAADYGRFSEWHGIATTTDAPFSVPCWTRTQEEAEGWRPVTAGEAAAGAEAARRGELGLAAARETAAADAVMGAIDRMVDGAQPVHLLVDDSGGYACGDTRRASCAGDLRLVTCAACLALALDIRPAGPPPTPEQAAQRIIPGGFEVRVPGGLVGREDCDGHCECSGVTDPDSECALGAGHAEACLCGPCYVVEMERLGREIRAGIVTRDEAARRFGIGDPNERLADFMAETTPDDAEPAPSEPSCTGTCVMCEDDGCELEPEHEGDCWCCSSDCQDPEGDCAGLCSTCGAGQAAEACASRAGHDGPCICEACGVPFDVGDPEVVESEIVNTCAPSCPFPCSCGAGCVNAGAAGHWPHRCVIHADGGPLCGQRFRHRGIDRECSLYAGHGMTNHAGPVAVSHPEMCRGCGVRTGGACGCGFHLLEVEELPCAHGELPECQDCGPPDRLRSGTYGELASARAGRVSPPVVPSHVNIDDMARLMGMTPDDLHGAVSSGRLREVSIGYEVNAATGAARVVSASVVPARRAEQGDESGALDALAERCGTKRHRINSHGRESDRNLRARVGGILATVLASWVQRVALPPPGPGDHAREAAATLAHWLTAPGRWWQGREERRARLGVGTAGAVNRALVGGTLGLTTGGLPVEEDDDA